MTPVPVGFQLRAQEQEIRDIQREFATEREDYLETIRRQDQQLKLLQQLLDRVQPTIRKDCNYADVDAIKKQAFWDEMDQRWKLPDVQIVKTKLPPAGEFPRLHRSAKYVSFHPEICIKTYLTRKCI